MRVEPQKRITAQESEFTVASDRVKRAKVAAGLEVDVCGGNRNKTGTRGKNVEARPERRGRLIQVSGLHAWPFAAVQTIEEFPNGSNGFRRREGAVAGAVDKRTAQEFSVARFIDNLLVSTFILYDNQPVALGMQREHRNMNLPVENNIPFEIFHGFRIGGDARGVLERLEVCFEIEAGLRVKRANLFAADGMLELPSVVNARVPRNVTLRTSFEFRAKCKNERKVYLLIPERLIRFLPRVVVGRGFRRQWRKPTRQVRNRGSERQPSTALRRGLRFGKKFF